MGAILSIMSAYPLLSSVVLLYSRADQLFVASDSAVTTFDGTSVQDKICKTPVVGPGLLFARVGVLQATSPGFNVFELARRTAQAQHDPALAADLYGDAAACIDAAKSGYHEPDYSLHQFFFVGMDEHRLLSWPAVLAVGKPVGATAEIFRRMSEVGIVQGLRATMAAANVSGGLLAECTKTKPLATDEHG